MKEHYVSYSQAVKLKELGFDEPCEFYYNPYQELRISIDCLLAPKITNNRFLEEIADGMATAPRLDQAQAWLREVKGMAIGPCPSAKFVRNPESFKDCKWIHTGWIWQVLIIGTNKVLSNGPEDKNTLHSSSEEALSAGIDAALELLTNKP